MGGELGTEGFENGGPTPAYEAKTRRHSTCMFETLTTAACQCWQTFVLPVAVSWPHLAMHSLPLSVTLLRPRLLRCARPGAGVALRLNVLSLDQSRLTRQTVKKLHVHLPRCQAEHGVAY